MTLLESRGGGGGGVGDGVRGVEVLTNARYHSGGGTRNVKQKMMDTSVTQEDSHYMLHSQHQHQQQQHQQQHSSVHTSNSCVGTRTGSSPQTVPEVTHQSGIQSISERNETRHELKDWSEVSTVLLQNEDLKDQRHNLATTASDPNYNDRNNNNNNNNNPSENHMNF